MNLSPDGILAIASQQTSDWIVAALAGESPKLGKKVKASNKPAVNKKPKASKQVKATKKPPESGSKARR